MGKSGPKLDDFLMKKNDISTFLAKKIAPAARKNRFFTSPDSIKG